MRPAEVSEPEIVEAAQRLAAEGKRVNGWSLRRAVGDRGKPERLLEVWQRAEAADPVPSQAPESDLLALPPGVAEAADAGRLALVAHYDGVLLTLARQIEGDLKTRYRADFERLTNERADMQDQLAAASASVASTEEGMLEARAEAEHLQARLAEAEKVGAITSERLRSAEQRAIAAAQESEDRIADLEQEVGVFGNEVQQARERVVAAEATAAAAERESERLRRQVADHEDALSAARQEAATTAAQLATSQAETRAAQQEAERLRAQLATIESAAATAREAAQREVSDLKARLASAEAEAKSQREHADRAETSARQALERAGAAEQRATRAAQDTEGAAERASTAEQRAAAAERALAETVQAAEAARGPRPA